MMNIQTLLSFFPILLLIWLMTKKKRPALEPGPAADRAGGLRPDARGIPEEPQ
jgi:hypothetical protein